MFDVISALPLTRHCLSVVQKLPHDADSIVKGKGFPYSLPIVGPGADPDVQAVRVSPASDYIQVIHPAVGCHYFPPGLRSYLPSRRASPHLGRHQVILLGNRCT